MKNQYCGDINDYRKYGLLRVFAKYQSFKLGVCWMLTPRDDRNDGSRRNYLGRPNRFGALDPQLFDKLSQIHSVGEVEHERLIPGAIFWKDDVPRSTAKREMWLEKMCGHFTKTEIVFFDPDNGLEVKSKAWKATASPKHLYWHELRRVWAGGQSIIVYQHFRREQRDQFISKMKRELHKATGCSAVFALRTSHVVFLIAPQECHRERLTCACGTVEQKWQNEIALQ
jgi:hypothetical protein